MLVCFKKKSFEKSNIYFLLNHSNSENIPLRVSIYKSLKNFNQHLKKKIMQTNVFEMEQEYFSTAFTHLSCLDMLQ